MIGGAECATTLVERCPPLLPRPVVIFVNYVQQYHANSVKSTSTLPHHRACSDARAKLQAAAVLLSFPVLVLQTRCQQGRHAVVTPILQAIQPVFHAARSRVATKPDKTLALQNKRDFKHAAKVRVQLHIVLPRRILEGKAITSRYGGSTANVYKICNKSEASARSHVSYKPATAIDGSCTCAPVVVHGLFCAQPLNLTSRRGSDRNPRGNSPHSAWLDKSNRISCMG